MVVSLYKNVSRRGSISTSGFEPGGPNPLGVQIYCDTGTAAPEPLVGRSSSSASLSNRGNGRYSPSILTNKSERDALRFHWRSSEEDEIESLRFTLALFGLAPSPFLLNGVLEAHLDAWEERCPDVVAELRRSLYVDDLLTGGQTVTQARRNKEVAMEILNDATF